MEQASVDKIKKYVKEHNLTFPQLHDPTLKVASTYGVRGVPTTLFIDAHGRVIGGASGLRAWDSEVAQEFVEQLLAEKEEGTELSSLPKNASGYSDMTAEQLKEALKKKNFTLVNVHIPYEGEIPQTDLQIPFNEIAEHLDKLPGKDQPIVLYCRSGGMSTAASKTLFDLGYTNIIELNGGFNAWKQAGYEFLMKESQ